MPDQAYDELEDYDDRKLWALSSRRVVTPSGLRTAAVAISGETIVDVVAPNHFPHRARLKMWAIASSCRA